MILNIGAKPQIYSLPNGTTNHTDIVKIFKPPTTLDHGAQHTISSMDNVRAAQPRGLAIIPMQVR